MFELFTTKHISFAQALTGIDILVSHINGEHLRLNSTTPLSEKTYLVQNGGMPIDESYREKLRGLPLDKKYGDLHVQIIIDWPKELTAVQKQQIIKYFPYTKPEIDPLKVKDVPLEQEVEPEHPQAQSCSTQ